MDKYLHLALNKHYVETPDAAVSAAKGAADKPLAGTVICLAKKLNSLSNDLSALVTSLGGQFRGQYDSTATHLIYQVTTVDYFIMLSCMRRCSMHCYFMHL